MIKIKFSILGKRWTIRYLNRKEYHKKNGNDSVAITYVHKRRIDISHAGSDKGTITHELVHAYLAELCTHSSNLDCDELEEIFAELLARRGRELLNLADRLLNKIREARKVVE